MCSLVINLASRPGQSRHHPHQLFMQVQKTAIRSSWKLWRFGVPVIPRLRREPFRVRPHPFRPAVSSKASARVPRLMQLRFLCRSPMLTGVWRRSLRGCGACVAACGTPPRCFSAPRWATWAAPAAGQVEAENACSRWFRRWTRKAGYGTFTNAGLRAEGHVDFSPVNREYLVSTVSTRKGLRQKAPSIFLYHSKSPFFGTGIFAITDLCQSMKIKLNIILNGLKFYKCT